MSDPEPSFYEQMKAFDKSESQKRFIEALDAKSGILVSSDDILTAAAFTRDELFLITLMTIAKARIEREQGAPK